MTPTRSNRLFWLECRTEDVPSGGQWLGARERAALSRLRFTRRRASWRLGRWTAKVALVGTLGDGLRPRDVEIVAAEDGAPEAFARGAQLPVRISISHSGCVGLCVVTPGVPDAAGVGCDVEQVEPRAAAFVDDYFTPCESAWVREHRGLDRAVAETLVWSAKESALKVLRQGMRRDTRSVVVGRMERGLAAHEWKALSVSLVDGSRSLSGWWRCTGEFVYTVVTDGPCSVPVPPPRLDEIDFDQREKGRLPASPSSRVVDYGASAS